jgi:hypothetical protein
MAVEQTLDALTLVHFLVVFDGPGRRLLLCERFDDDDDGLAAYAAAEDRYRGRPGIEVVLLSSDSLETIFRTHGQYFESADTPDLPTLVGI